MANQVDFYFGNGRAGRLDIASFPGTSGRVTYEPYRSGSHHAMGLAIRDAGFADCYYEVNGRRVYFRVIEVPAYGSLQIDNISE